MKKRTVIYLNPNKAEMFKKAKDLDLAPGSEAERTFAEALSDLAVHCMVDTNTGVVSIINVVSDNDFSNKGVV